MTVKLSKVFPVNECMAIEQYYPTTRSNIVDFSSLTAFKRTIKCVNFSDFLNFT